MFANAIKRHRVRRKIFYVIVQKFSFFIHREEALNNDIQPETSYAYDIEIIKKLYERKKLRRNIRSL